MWETTYYHIVPSHSSVIEWYKGSGLRPYLELLDQIEKQEFINDLLKLIETSYPVQADSSVILNATFVFYSSQVTNFILHNNKKSGLFKSALFLLCKTNLLPWQSVFDCSDHLWMTYHKMNNRTFIFGYHNPFVMFYLNLDIFKNSCMLC